VRVMVRVRVPGHHGGKVDGFGGGVTVRVRASIRTRRCTRTSTMALITPALTLNRTLPLALTLTLIPNTIYSLCSGGP